MTTQASANPVDAAYRVSERCQAEKVDGVLLDLTTARAIIAVYERLETRYAREKMQSLSLVRCVDIVWRLIS